MLTDAEIVDFINSTTDVAQIAAGFVALECPSEELAVYQLAEGGPTTPGEARALVEKWILDSVADLMRQDQEDRFQAAAEAAQRAEGGK